MPINGIMGLSLCNSEWILSLDADYILTQEFC